MESNEIVNQQGSQKKKRKYERKIKHTFYTDKKTGKLVKVVYAPVTLLCKVCSNKFTVKFHERFERATCAKKECKSAYQKLVQRGERITRICPICTKSFELAPFQLKRRKTCGDPMCTKLYRNQEKGCVKLTPYMVTNNWKLEYYLRGENDTYYRIDFAKPQSKLAVFIDEINHNQRKTILRDKLTNDYLVSIGWKIKRINEEQIFTNLSHILQEISFFDPSETTRQ